MSSISEQQKNLYMNQLAKFRSAILSFTEPSPLRAQVEILEKHLIKLEEESTGDLKTVVQTTLGKIKKFQMHDTTRFEVCRWVQTIIYELNQL